MSAVLRSAVIDIVLPFWLARRRPARGPSASESGRAGMSSSAVARNASRREIPARDEGVYTRKPPENQWNLRPYGQDRQGTSAVPVPLTRSPTPAREERHGRVHVFRRYRRQRKRGAADPLHHRGEERPCPGEGGAAAAVAADRTGDELSGGRPEASHAPR